VAVRLYLRYGLSYRDVEELMAERGHPIEAGHGRLKAWLRPMPGLKRHRSTRIRGGVP
jgi:transposase-like protein